MVIEDDDELKCKYDNLYWDVGYDWKKPRTRIAIENEEFHANLPDWIVEINNRPPRTWGKTN